MRNSLRPVVVALALPGCALLGKSEPLVPRYFTPEYAASAPAAPAVPALRLRLGRVEGRASLRERMASRLADREVRYAEDRRWTERPEVYLRRALARTLFEERGLVEAQIGRALTLDVELIAFEEVVPLRLARLEARLVLRDDRVALLEETITAEQPIAAAVGDDVAPAVVEALSQALQAGVARMADRVIAAMATAPPPAAR